MARRDGHARWHREPSARPVPAGRPWARKGANMGHAVDEDGALERTIPACGRSGAGRHDRLDGPAASELHAAAVLQRTVGNDALAGELESRRAGPVVPAAGQRGGPSAQPGVADRRARLAAEVVDDPAAEAEADRVAELATARLGERLPSSPLVGGSRHATLHPSLRSAIAAVVPDRGVLDSLRIQSDGAASGEAASIDARAFTRGDEIVVDQRELSDPGEATRLLAHEAAHGVLHARDAAPADGRDPVHPKLRGVGSALEAQGGGRTSGWFRRAVGWLKHWDRLLDDVGEYEAMEQDLLQELDKITARGYDLKSSGQARLVVRQRRPELLHQLGRIVRDCERWLEANPETLGEVTSAEIEKANKNIVTPPRQKGQAQTTVQNGPSYLPSTDPRYKAKKRQAIAQLLPRVRTEIGDLTNSWTGHWFASLGLSDQLLLGTGAKDAGAKNEVQELVYGLPGGKEFTGYFKAETPYNPIRLDETGQERKPEKHETAAGIPAVDPNYGARAVASWRIDQLFDARVTARAEFAVHEGRLGTVLETAKGQKSTEVSWNLPFSENTSGGSMVDPADPVLQRALNKLQLVDAICGQLDRHRLNYRVQVDEQGRVQSVTGIDLDMSFGRAMTHPNELKPNADKDPGFVMAPHYPGLPALVDKEFGERLLDVDPATIEVVLEGLLSKEEIAATVLRFKNVQAYVRDLQRRGLLVDTWGEATAELQRGRGSGPLEDRGNVALGGQIATERFTDAARAIDRACTKMRDEKEWAGTAIPLPAGIAPEVVEWLLAKPEAARAMFGFAVGQLLRGPVQDLLWQGAIPPEQVIAFLACAVNDIVRGDPEGFERALTPATARTASEAKEEGPGRREPEPAVASMAQVRGWVGQRFATEWDAIVGRYARRPDFTPVA
jgi:hypothetical protein